MAMRPMTDLGGHCVASFGGCCIDGSDYPIAITAGGTGDATAVTGTTVDTLGYDSALVVITWEANLAADKTLAISAERQSSSDDSTWATAVALQASTVVATDSGSGSQLSGVTQFSVNTSALPRYFRVNFTPDLNASGTDTAVLVCTVIMGGDDKLIAAAG